MTTTKRAAALLLLALSASAASGCAAVGDSVHREKTRTYDTTAEYAADAPVSAAWIPSEADTITLRTPADEESGIAVLLMSSESALPESCAEGERRSSPMLSIDGEPDVYSPKAGSAFVCGDWTVMRADDGRFGWTPNAEDQAG